MKTKRVGPRSKFPELPVGMSIIRQKKGKGGSIYLSLKAATVSQDVTMSRGFTDEDSWDEAYNECRIFLQKARRVRIQRIPPIGFYRILRRLRLKREKEVIWRLVDL